MSSIPSRRPTAPATNTSRTRDADHNNDVNRLTVALKGGSGAPADTFTVKLSDGRSEWGRLSPRGKARAKFMELPEGTGTVTVTWDCGATQERKYGCVLSHNERHLPEHDREGAGSYEPLQNRFLTGAARFSRCFRRTRVKGLNGSLPDVRGTVRRGANPQEADDRDGPALLEPG